MTARPRLAVAVAVLMGGLTISSGCWTAFRPTETHASRDGDMQASIVSTDTLGHTFSVNVVLELPPGHRAADAWLTSAASPPCQQGISTKSHYPGALHANQRSFDFELDAVTGAGLLTDVPAVIDVAVLPADLHAARRCLRVSVTSPAKGAEWLAFPPWFVAAGFRYLAAPSRAGSVESGGLASFGGGSWIGPLRWRIDWLFGEAGTHRPPPDGYSKMTVQLLGGSAAVEMFPLRLGPWGLGLQLGCEYLMTDFHADNGGNAQDTYVFRGPWGPRAAVRLARLPWPRRWPGFRARPDSWSMGVDVFAARWYGLDDLAPMHYGIAFSGEWGRWW